MAKIKIKSCGFLIYRNTSPLTFLLMKHRNRWDLPKGHVDPGETNLECALRELEEETGITERDIRIDPDFKFKQKYMVNGKKHGPEPQKKKLILYLAELIRPVKIIPTEHPGFRWFDWDPPHAIQQQTIDPLLAALEKHWQTTGSPADRLKPCNASRRTRK